MVDPVSRARISVISFRRRRTISAAFRKSRALCRRTLRPTRKCLRGGIHGAAFICTSARREAGKELSAIGLVDLEYFIVRSFLPLVASKVAVFLHVGLCGLHILRLFCFMVESWSVCQSLQGFRGFLTTQVLSALRA